MAYYEINLYAIQQALAYLILKAFLVAVYLQKFLQTSSKYYVNRITEHEHNRNQYLHAHIHTFVNCTTL